MDADSLLTTSELAAKLKVTTGSIYKGAQSGKIPSYRIGPKSGGLRFDLKEVLRAMRRSTQVPANGGSHATHTLDATH